MPLKVGDKAPEFKLFYQDAKSVSLNDYNGNNIVLLFFPFANSSVCTAEMGQIRDNYEKYEDLNASVIGVSVDSHYALKMWSEKNNFNFPLLSDFNKEVSAKYDSLYDIFAPGKYDYNGVSKRSAFVINKEGNIKYLEICNSPGDQPDYNAIEKVLNELK
jgi:glutaredoxin-dependent peroxiredoxin